MSKSQLPPYPPDTVQGRGPLQGSSVIWFFCSFHHIHNISTGICSVLTLFRSLAYSPYAQREFHVLGEFTQRVFKRSRGIRRSYGCLRGIKSDAEYIWMYLVESIKVHMENKPKAYCRILLLKRKIEPISVNFWPTRTRLKLVLNILKYTIEKHATVPLKCSHIRAVFSHLPVNIDKHLLLFLLNMTDNVIVYICISATWQGAFTGSMKSVIVVTVYCISLITWSTTVKKYSVIL
jgi:hypothetical protein